MGGWSGRNLFEWLDRCPGLARIAVAPGRRMEDSGEPGFETYARYDMESYARHVMDRAVGYGERCKVRRRASVEAAKTVPDGSLDFVLIDACHAEASVGADISALAPTVKPSV